MPVVAMPWVQRGAAELATIGYVKVTIIPHDEYGAERVRMSPDVDWLFADLLQEIKQRPYATALMRKSDFDGERYRSEFSTGLRLYWEVVEIQARKKFIQSDDDAVTIQLLGIEPWSIHK